MTAQYGFMATNDSGSISLDDQSSIYVCFKKETFVNGSLTSNINYYNVDIYDERILRAFSSNWYSTVGVNSVISYPATSNDLLFKSFSSLPAITVWWLCPASLIATTDNAWGMNIYDAYQNKIFSTELNNLVVNIDKVLSINLIAGQRNPYNPSQGFTPSQTIYTGINNPAIICAGTQSSIWSSVTGICPNGLRLGQTEFPIMYASGQYLYVMRRYFAKTNCNEGYGVYGVTFDGLFNYPVQPVLLVDQSRLP